jgi:hypothetical protein
MLGRPSTAEFQAKRGRVKRTLRSMLTPEQMNVALRRESARVDRKGRAGKCGNDRIGSSAGTLVLVLFRPADGDLSSPLAARLAKTLLHRIRVTDDVGWFDDDHIGVILPETSPVGAWRLAQHVCERVAAHGPRPHCVMYSYPATGLGTDEPAGVIRQQDDDGRATESAQSRMVPRTAKAG